VNPIDTVLAALNASRAETGARPEPRCAHCDRVPVSRVGLVCAQCHPLTELAHRRAALAAARASIPPVFRDVGRGELQRRTQLTQKTLDEASGALERRRVVLMGPAGFGKTSLACWMLQQVIEAGVSGPKGAFARGRRARFVDAVRLCRAVREHALGEGEAPMLAMALTASVLVLDDVGQELGMRMASNPVMDVIRDRHSIGRTTWVTTFLTPEAMETAYGSGTVRRIFDEALVMGLGTPR
jgi:hypothetical protein